MQTGAALHLQTLLMCPLIGLLALLTADWSSLPGGGEARGHLVVYIHEEAGLGMQN